MEQKFKRVIKDLNAEQRSAVDTIDGPLLAIAGPGTGKTELLSTRVANILHIADARPSEILCLTFTNKAAVNMKERIVRLAGRDGARVAAKTFHSFAGEIMNSYPDYFWSAAEMSVAPETVQLDIIESIVAKLPLDNPLALKFAGQYTLLKDIQQAINLAKDAGLTPDKLRSLITANLAYIDIIEPRLVKLAEPRLSAKTLNDLLTKVKALPKMKTVSDIYPMLFLNEVLAESLEAAIEHDRETGKTSNCGLWKRRWVQSVAGVKAMHNERRRNQWWLELADVYDDYRQAIHERGFYDYADMLVETLAQLDGNPEMLADIQERYRYVLIDEFQDTNPAQLRLAHLVADHPSAEGSPNLMAVGDDDQSIFKFSGAELNNMLGFRRTYPKAKVIVLRDNYRSSQAILDMSKRIIEQAETRLVTLVPDLSKDLRAVKPPKIAGEIKAYSFSSRELQFSEIARQIKKAYKPDKEIAVLARNHDSLVRMTGILESLGVPVRYEQAANTLDHEIVNQAYLVARLLLAIRHGDKDEANALLQKILRAPAWGIKPMVLWQLALSNGDRGNWLESVLKSDDKDLVSLGSWFVDLSRDSETQPLAVTLEQIIGLRPSPRLTSPIRDYYTKGAGGEINRYFHSLSAIQLLRALVHEFGRQSEPTLEELVRFIEVNKTNGRIVPDESPFITAEHGVQLLTVHKAKGLEFDSVYIIDAVEDNWQPRRGGRKPPSNLPLQPPGDELDDYVRLLYVAATRAMSTLIISGYYQDHAGKDVAISPIVQAALPMEQVDVSDPKKIITVLEENLHWPELSGGQEKQMLKARLETYSLSVTHLLNFLDLTRGGPQYFKERNLLRLPEVKTPSLSFGTAIHAALKQAQLQSNRQSFRLAEVQKTFKAALSAEQLSRTDFERYLPKGEQLLAKLLKTFKYKLPPGSLPEQDIKDVKLDKAIIRGQLDRIDKDEELLKIVDYKTGRPLGGFTSTDQAKALKAWRHKTQLIFYALLASQHPRFSHAKSIEGQMVYVEAETPRQLVLSYVPTVEDIDYLRRLIEAVWPKIINLDLPDVSAYSQDLAGIKAFEQDLLSGK